MAVRFRKSKKVAPGTKINIGKKSSGVSFGNRGGGISFNSRSGVHVRASIPGTGISFTSKVGGRKRRKAKKRQPSRSPGLLVSMVVFALACWALPVLIPIFILAIVGIIVWAVVSAKREHDAGDSDSVEAGDTSSSVSFFCSGCGDKFTIQYTSAAVVDGALDFTCPKCGQRLRVDTSGKQGR